MFSHIMVETNALDRARKFYDALLGTLGVPPAMVDGNRIFYFGNGGIFSVSLPINGQPATPANEGTIGFACSSPEQANAWHAAGLAHWMRRLPHVRFTNLYGPTEAAINKTWKPGDIELTTAGVK